MPATRRSLLAEWGIAWDAFVRAKYKCEYCDLDVAATGQWYMYDHDHIVPRRVAGDEAHHPLNIACACIICNPRQSPGLGYKRVVSCKDSFQRH